MPNVFERARAIRMVGEPWQNAVQRAGSQLRYESQTGGSSEERAAAAALRRPGSGSSGGPSLAHASSAASLAPGSGSRYAALPLSGHSGESSAYGPPAAAAPVSKSKSKSRSKARLSAAKGNDVRCSRSAKGRCRINKAWVKRCKATPDLPECGDQYRSHVATRHRIKAARENKMRETLVRARDKIPYSTLGFDNAYDAYQDNQRAFMEGKGKFHRERKGTVKAKEAMEQMRGKRVTYSSNHYPGIEQPKAKAAKRLAKKYLAELKHLGVDTSEFHLTPPPSRGQLGGAHSGGERAKGHAACGYQNGRCRRTKASVRNTDLTNARRKMAHAQRIQHGTNVTSGWTEFVTQYRGAREESGVRGQPSHREAHPAGDNNHLWVQYKRDTPGANFITFCSQEWSRLRPAEKERLNDAATKAAAGKREVARLAAHDADPRRPRPITTSNYFSGGSQDGGWDGFSDTSSTRSSDFTSVSDTTSFSASTDSSSMW